VTARARSISMRLLPILMIPAPAAALLLAAGCNARAPHAAPTAAQTVASASAQFVGDTVCAECHRAEYDSHRKSRHANTMRPADIRSLGSLAPPTGPIPHSDYAIREQEGSLRFERVDRPTLGAPIRFALGSGKTAMTYLGEFGAESLTEFRMSYLPTRRAWCITPGQDARSDLGLGETHEMGMARRCIHCHAVNTAPGSVEPAPGFLGVGCESCHGPGGAHVAAVRAGRFADLKMDDMHRWGAARIDAVCARCHRSIDDVSLTGIDASATARFQGYGLELSPCFRKSRDRLSCTTCHDPHTDVSTDRHTYEKVCLSCHAPTASAQHACPVNPQERCLGCHLPPRPIFPGQRISVTMADHLILAYRNRR
jgi:hypothetical protein